jgi:hypothetical protein
MAHSARTTTPGGPARAAKARHAAKAHRKAVGSRAGHAARGIPRGGGQQPATGLAIYHVLKRVHPSIGISTRAMALLREWLNALAQVVTDSAAAAAGGGTLTHARIAAAAAKAHVPPSVMRRAAAAVRCFLATNAA